MRTATRRHRAALAAIPGALGAERAEGLATLMAFEANTMVTEEEPDLRPGLHRAALNEPPHQTAPLAPPRRWGAEYQRGRERTTARRRPDQICRAWRST
jgi:hypothetical protein